LGGALVQQWDVEMRLGASGKKSVLEVKNLFCGQEDDGRLGWGGRIESNDLWSGWWGKGTD
jgi:hypothetical protein